MDLSPGAVIALTLAAIWGALRTWAELVAPPGPRPWIGRPDDTEGTV